MDELLTEIPYNVPIELKYSIIFENLVWKSDSSQIEILNKLVSVLNKEWIQLLIFHISQYNIFSYKFLGDLFQETNDLSIQIAINPYFCDYLYIRHIIKEDDLLYNVNQSVIKAQEEYEHPIKEDTLWDIIMKDDIKSFTSCLASNNINPKFEKIRIFQTTFYIAEFVAYCGSINILKYMFLNKFDFNSFYCIKAAIQGGNENVVEFLIEKGFNFDIHLINAVAFHQNNLAKWCYEKYQPSFNITKCVQTFNTEFMLYYIDQCVDYRKDESLRETLITCTAHFSNTSLSLFLKEMMNENKLCE